MKFYDRWIASPWREMPFWPRRVCTLLALAAGFAVSYSLGSGLGQEMLLYLLVAGGITLAVGIAWRATHA